MLFPVPVNPQNSPAFQKYSRLTMPPGALDRLLIPALKILAQRNTADFSPLRFASIVFAGDHEVARNFPVSAFPCEVTAQMLVNFCQGGAAMAVLSQQRNAPLHVVDVGVATPYSLEKALLTKENIYFYNRNIPKAVGGSEYLKGARDLSKIAALSPEIFERAFNVGQEVVDAVCNKSPVDCIILGEMGIGNTTAATAIICALLNKNPEDITGFGTGILPTNLAVKTEVIRSALLRYKNSRDESSKSSAQEILAQLGGFELAALAGAACRAAEKGIFILLDGVISTAALLPVALHYSNFKHWLIAGHESAEAAHGHALKALDLEPLIRLNMRLGEGSGACIAAGLLQDATSLLREMATFESAAVSN